MGECSTISPSLPSGSGLGGRKRSRDSNSSHDSDDGCSPAKNTKYDILLELPERDTDPGSETEFSYQEDSTDLCCRSSTESSEVSEQNAGRIEYEIRSPEEERNIFGDSSTASDASVNELKWFRQPPPKYGNSSPSGASSGDSEGFDPEIPRRDYWTCLQCSNINNRPAFRYCEKCYKVRRDMFQPRLNPRKRRKRQVNRTKPSSTVMGGGIKLELCSQEHRDSGVACSQSSGLGCSQSALGSGQPASDSSPSADSGADTREFHGIRLSRTGVRVVELSPLTLRADSSFGRHRDSGQTDFTRTLSRGADKAGSLWPTQSQTFCGSVNSVKSVCQPANRGVDRVCLPSSQSIDTVDSVCPPANRGIDDVDSVHPPVSQDIDDVDSVHPPVSQDIDDVDSVHPPVSQDIDDVDSVHPPVSQDIDVVDSVHPPVSQDIDDVDSVHPQVSQDIDDVDSVHPPVSQDIDVVDSVHPPVSQDIDDVDSVHPPVSQDIDVIDSVHPPVSQDIDVVDSVHPPVSQDIDVVDSVHPPVSQDIDVVDSVHPLVSCVQLSMRHGEDDVDSVWPSTSQDVDSVHPSSIRGIKVDKGDLLPSPASLDVGKVSTLKHSVKTQTDLCFISQSGIPKDKPQSDVEKCMICYSRTLNGIFVHSTMAHMCCCYKCTVKVWKTTKRCPLCNCKVMNVLRLFKGC